MYYSYPLIYQAPIYRVLRYNVPLWPLCSPDIVFYNRTCVTLQPPIYRAPDFPCIFCFPPKSTVNQGITVTDIMIC